MSNLRTGAELLVATLEREGVDRVFCVPGESYLAVLDCFHDSPISAIQTRHESGAMMMADADARMTGRPGVCFVTRGPGATNAAAGLHISEHDSVPTILFVGQIARSMRERGAFQEIDYRTLFGGIAKWVAEIDSAERVPEMVSRAFHTAASGRPGPVVLALPEDMLTERAHAAIPDTWRKMETWPGAPQMAELGERLAESLRPVMILGGSDWSESAIDRVRDFADRFDLPVTCTFRRQSLFDHSHRCYIGDLGIGPNPDLLARVKQADLVLLAGARLPEIPSQGYTLFDIPETGRTLVHVHAGAEEPGRVYRPTLAINATPEGFAASLADLEPPASRPWAGDLERLRTSYLDWSGAVPKIPGDVQLGEIVRWMGERLPADTVLTNGAGNYATWFHRFWRFTRPRTQIGPISGSMGYGVPAAVAAKLREPERVVVALAGDGCFQMTGQEFGTAMQHGAAIIVLVIDNGIYGTIRMHQEREYPTRVSATDIRNPDFAALARAYGGHGETVERTEDFAPAFERALASGTAAIVHVRIDPEALSPSLTISGLRKRKV